MFWLKKVKKILSRFVEPLTWLAFKTCMNKNEVSMLTRPSFFFLKNGRFEKAETILHTVDVRSEILYLKSFWNFITFCICSIWAIFLSSKTWSRIWQSINNEFLSQGNGRWFFSLKERKFESRAILSKRK